MVLPNRLAWELSTSKPRWLTSDFVERILGLFDAAVIKKLPASVSVIFVGEKEMRDMNAYRGKTTSTDVLSFEIDTQDGEVYLCWPVVKRQAKDFGVSEEIESVRLIAHGLLHLAGYDHERGPRAAKIMFAAQDKVVYSFNGRDLESNPI